MNTFGNQDFTNSHLKLLKSLSKQKLSVPSSKIMRLALRAAAFQLRVHWKLLFLLQINFFVLHQNYKIFSLTSFRKSTQFWLKCFQSLNVESFDEKVPQNSSSIPDFSIKFQFESSSKIHIQIHYN